MINVFLKFQSYKHSVLFSVVLVNVNNVTYKYSKSSANETSKSKLNTKKVNKPARSKISENNLSGIQDEWFSLVLVLKGLLADYLLYIG